MQCNLNNLIVGTAQFGMDYGISNYMGRTKYPEILKIDKFLSSVGVGFYDTAPAYGVAESVVSDLIHNGSELKVITKIKAVESGNFKSVIESLYRSIDKFEGRLWGVLFHNSHDIKYEYYKPVMKEIDRLYQLGVIKNIGASVYNDGDIELLSENLKLDILQVPFNIYDQRFGNNENIKGVRRAGGEIHVRSVFLQGLILMNALSLPDDMSEIVSLQKKLYKYSKETETSVYQMCIKWVMQQNWIDKMVCGVNNLDQAKNLVDNFNTAGGVVDINLSEFCVSDINIINPSRWV